MRYPDGFLGTDRDVSRNKQRDPWLPVMMSHNSTGKNPNPDHVCGFWMFSPGQFRGLTWAVPGGRAASEGPERLSPASPTMTLMGYLSNSS